MSKCSSFVFRPNGGATVKIRNSEKKSTGEGVSAEYQGLGEEQDEGQDEM